MSNAMPLRHVEPKPVVVFVDDDAGNRQAFKAAFRHAMEVLTAADLAEVWQHLAQHRVHVVITDQRMPGTRGSELLSLVRDRYPHVRRMLVTAYSDLEAIIDAVNNGGVTKYFAKPWVNDQIQQAVKQAFQEIRTEEERVERLERLEETNRQLEFALRQRLLS
ncbi:MAG: response regulator [Flavobacteriales bacterium]|nr:response regulator [Flavobacteriales bacterium]